jgi:hypothetical protein
MQDAGTVLEVLRERGRRGLPCDELYRQMFNKGCAGKARPQRRNLTAQPILLR